MKNEQTGQEVISVAFKTAKIGLDVFRVVGSAFYKKQVYKHHKQQNKEYKFLKKQGQVNWNEFVKKVKNYQSVSNFCNYDQKLCNRISKKYGLKFAARYDSVKDTYHVIIANGSLDKVEDFRNEYNKEFDKMMRERERINNIKKQREKIRVKDYEKQKAERGEIDLDNDGVIDRLDPDKNNSEIKNIKDLEKLDKINRTREEISR